MPAKAGTQADNARALRRLVPTRSSFRALGHFVEVPTQSSFQPKLESMLILILFLLVIPAKAGIHGRSPLRRSLTAIRRLPRRLLRSNCGSQIQRQQQNGSQLRWNDGEVGADHASARAVMAWIPAFAGMTF